MIARVLPWILKFLPGFAPGLGAFFNPWVLGIAAIAFLGFGAWCGFKGYELGRSKLDDYIGKQAVEAVRIVTRQGEVTERVVTKYIKVKGETQVRTQVVEKEVIRYVEAGLDRYPLSRAAVVLHDAAALNAVPDPAGAVDGSASGLEAAALTQACTENYATYHQTADRLRALQDWTREQRKVTTP